MYNLLSRDGYVPGSEAASLDWLLGGALMLIGAAVMVAGSVEQFGLAFHTASGVVEGKYLTTAAFDGSHFWMRSNGPQPRKFADSLQIRRTEGQQQVSWLSV